MLRTYSVNIAGPSHVRHNIPCQDSCCVETCGNVVIAAVADGLGSESHSDVGSRFASQAAVAHCRDRLAANDANCTVDALLDDAFHAAYQAVLDASEARNVPVGEMDCTLCLALFDGHRVAYGYAGDSGLIAALDDGRYEPLTTMQRDDEGRVFPLCYEERWVFGMREGVYSVLLATDGVLEGLIVPPALARWTDNPVDTLVARSFLHPDLEDGSLEELQDAAEDFLRELPVELVDDDKTVVVAFDDARPAPLMPEAYYEGPDWEAIAEKANAVLYVDAAERRAAQAPAAPAFDPVHVRDAATKPALRAPSHVEGRTVKASAVTRRPVHSPAKDALDTVGEALSQLGWGTIAVATAAAGAAAGVSLALAVTGTELLAESESAPVPTHVESIETVEH